LIDVPGRSKEWPTHTDLAKQPPRFWKEIGFFSSLFFSHSLSTICVKVSDIGGRHWLIGGPGKLGGDRGLGVILDDAGRCVFLLKQVGKVLSLPVPQARAPQLWR
jgi:hypothetical protein